MGRNDTVRDLMIKHLNVWTNKIKINCIKIGLYVQDWIARV